MSTGLSPRRGRHQDGHHGVELVSKLLSSLIPAYSERATVEHHHSGSVWIEGQTAQPQLPPSSRDQFGDAFGSAAPAAQQQRQTNLLALPRPCVDTAEFNSRYRDKKLLRVVTLFRDAEGHLLPPLRSGKGLFVVESECPQFLRTVPVLTRDKRFPEKYSDNCENHLADACRYLLNYDLTPAFSTSRRQVW
jgi:hypothetical protein